MAEWKKVIVSGSDISQLNNDAGYLTNASVGIPNGYATASFNGSDLLANSTAGTLNFASESGEGLNIVANTGTRTLTLGLDSIPNTSLANSTISGIALGSDLANLTIGNGLASSAAYNGGTARTAAVGQGIHITVNTNDVAVNTTTLIPAISGSIIDTIAGDVNVNAGGVSTIQVNAVEGTMLNSNTVDDSTLALSSNQLIVKDAGIDENKLNTSVAGTGLSGGGGSALSVDYGSSTGNAVQGNTNITINVASGELTRDAGDAAQALGGAPSYTLGLADTISGNRTFSGNTITINNDLVVQGTASFQSTENLQVADQFILLNSGSSSTGPGGIVIEQGTDDIGEALAWSSADVRWGVTGSFDAASTSFNPDAYVNVVVEGTSNDPDTEVVAKYDKRGNMFVGNTGGIWIYV